MADLATHLNYTADLDRGVQLTELRPALLSGDVMAHRFVVDCLRDGKPVPLAGATVQGYFVRADETTVLIPGTTSGSAAMVTLPADCYAVPGRFALVIRVTQGGVVNTVLWAQGSIGRATTATVTDPAAVLPTPEQVLAIIQRADAAAAAAEAAAPGIVASETGSLVYVPDAAARPAVSLVSRIEPAQAGSGDPAPDNVRPISGCNSVSVRHNGKNFMTDFTFNNYTTAGITWKNFNDGTITATGTATDNAYTYGLGNCVLGVLPAGPYAAAFFPADSATAVGLRVGKKTEEDSNAFVNNTATGKNVVYFNADGVSVYRIGLFIRKDSTVNGLVIKPQIERDALTDYEPPLLQSLTAELPETVYGGALDWITGELTVTHAVKVFDGTESVSVDASGTATYSPEQEPLAGGAALSSHYAAGALSCSAHISISNALTGTGYSSFSAYAAAQHAAGTPITIVYPIAAPYTLQLTPHQPHMQKGMNSLSSSCGDTALDYLADTRLYIDQRIAALTAAVLSTGANI